MKIVRGPRQDWEENLTESEKMDREDKFILKFAPNWFRMLEWLIILGVLEYFIEETSSYILQFLKFISLGLLVWYLNAILFRVNFYSLVPIRYLKNAKTAHLINVIIAGVVFLLIILYLPDIVEKLSDKF